MPKFHKAAWPSEEQDADVRVPEHGPPLGHGVVQAHPNPGSDRTPRTQHQPQEYARHRLVPERTPQVLLYLPRQTP
ncbi:UNVERIFIED_CONTAM: hypothetical protein GTU68_062582 [Idotea baltica]|nr:hypothetical protein [Idotea baltica]